MPIISALNGSFYIRAVLSIANSATAYQVVTEASLHSISGYYANSVSFNNDGTKAYLDDMEISGSTSFSISEYSLSTPYDLSTATYTTRKLASYPGLSDTGGTTWNNDGTKIYIGAEMQSGTTDRPRIVEFNVSTPYDISTMSTSPNTYINSTSYTTNLTWNNDGTKLFAAIDTSGIVEITASTPYSLVGATKTTFNSTSLVGESARLWGIDFNKTGTIAFIVQSQVTDDKIWKLELSTPYDLTTATVVDTYITTDYDITYPFSLTVADNYLIIFGSSDAGPGRSFTYFDSSVIGTINAPKTEATMTTRAYIDTSDSSVEYDYYSGNIRILDNGSKVAYSGSYNDGTSHRDMRIATLNTPYDISSSTTATSIFEPSNFVSAPYIPITKAPRDFWISNDGLTLYVMYGNWATNQTYWAREIYKFTLPSPWDLSSITDWTPTQTFSIASTTASEQTAGMGTSDHFPFSFWFNDTGTKLFIFTADSNALAPDHLLEYPLSTPYDLASAGTRTWHKFIDGTDPLNQLQSGESFVPNRIEFNDDGTKLFGIFSKSGFIVGITTWTLGTAWDISTLSKDSWEQDISDAYTDDSSNILGASSRGTFPTAFANNNLYITDILHTSAGGLNTSPIYRWDVSDIDYSGTRAFYSYSITNDTQSNSVDEGSTVVFTVSAPDIPDGSTIYWEIDPYSFTEIEDFDPATRSGTATFSNGTTTITVNIATDILDETSQNERFNLRTARNQNVYNDLFPLVSSNLISIGEVPWISLDHTIQPSGLATTDRLGGNKASKGMNSTYTVVAAYNKADGANELSGEVYLYNTSTGALERTFTNPNAYNTTSGDIFGYSVGLSDSYLIVGAMFEDSAGGNSSGKAYVFNLSDGSLKYTLNNPNTYGTEDSDHFGNSVAITDNYAIVGAYYEDSGTFGQETGAAYIFDMSDGSLAYTLTNPDSEPGTQDWFGFSVSINQHYAAVGAPLESYDISAVNTGGKVYLYRLDTGTLTQTIDNPGSNATYNANDQFGWDVSLTNKHLIVGANQATTVDDSGTNTNAGKVDVFNIRDGAHFYTLENPTFGGINDYFGDTVDGSDNFLIVGTRDLDGTNNGGAYIYNINSGDYITTLSNPNTYNGPDGDRFGSTVAILDDGTAAVGAWGEDTASTTDSGALYIYSSTYPTPSGGYTYKAIGDRGLIRGATNATYTNKTQYFDITTLGNAADFGFGGGGYTAGMSSGTRGLWAGGSTATDQGGGTSVVYWVTTATLGDSNVWSSLLGATAFSAGVSDGDRGVIVGGSESFTDATNVMHYISLHIASYQGFDFGNLTYATAQAGGAADATHGIKAGGYYNDTYLYRRVEMEKFTIQTTGGATYLGNLTQARRKITGTSNGTLGLFAGGLDSSELNIIDYLTIATDTSATDFGDLSSALRGVSACSNETRAVFGGGYNGSSGSTALQYVSYDTPGNATSFGSLVAGTNNEGGTGLSGNAA